MKLNQSLQQNIKEAVALAKEHLQGGGHVHADGSVNLVPVCPMCVPEYGALLTAASKREILGKK